MKKVEAYIVEMFKITIGDNGCSFGQYDPGDEWSESFYGNDLLQIAKDIAKSTYKASSLLAGNLFEFERVKVLKYEDRIFDFEIIEYYDRYDKQTKLEKEVAAFYKHLQSDDVITIRVSLKDEYERDVKIQRERDAEEKKRILDAEEKTEYERLKAKFGQ